MQLVEKLASPPASATAATAAVPHDPAAPPADAPLAAEGMGLLAVIGLLCAAMKLRPWFIAKILAIARLNRWRSLRDERARRAREAALRRRTNALSISSEEAGIAPAPIAAAPSAILLKAPSAILLRYRRALKKSFSKSPHSASSTPPRHSRRWFNLGRATRS